MDGVPMTGAVSHIHWLPIIICLWLPLSFLTTYLIAVQQGHVYPLFPAISDTGTLPPESCVFSLLVNVLALLLVFAVWLRGRQLRHVGTGGGGPSRLANMASNMLGYLACFGLYIVANCQETNTLLFHFVGALVSFWSSFLYCVTQTIFSYWLINEMNSVAIFVARVVLCLAQLFLNVFTFYTFFIAVSLFKGEGVGRALQWRPEDPGWGWHLAATTSEWALAFCIALFVLTFHPDFKRITLKPPKVKLIGYKYEMNNGTKENNYRSEIPLDATTRI